MTDDADISYHDLCDCEPEDHEKFLQKKTLAGVTRGDHLPYKAVEDDITIRKMSKLVDLAQEFKKPKETCHLGQIHNDLDMLKDDEFSYIHEHLEFLFFLTCTAKPNKILEIGTGRGDSTLAFAFGCYGNRGGSVITIDINDCHEAKRLINNNGLMIFVTFLKSDSLTAPITGDYDMIFIDGLHTYQQVYQELDKFSKNLNNGGWIILHDTNNPAHKGVKKAVDQFLNETRNHYKYTRFDFFHCNGLTVLHKSW